MARYGYARVSSTDQDYATQSLFEWACLADAYLIPK